MHVAFFLHVKLRLPIFPKFACYPCDLDPRLHAIASLDLPDPPNPNGITIELAVFAQYIGLLARYQQTDRTTTELDQYGLDR